jgi:hypothetical protein
MFCEFIKQSILSYQGSAEKHFGNLKTVHNQALQQMLWYEVYWSA